MLGVASLTLAGAEGAEPPGPVFFSRKPARPGALHVNVDVVAGIEGERREGWRRPTLAAPPPPPARPGGRTAWAGVSRPTLIGIVGVVVRRPALQLGRNEHCREKGKPGLYPALQVPPAGTRLGLAAPPADGPL